MAFKRKVKTTCNFTNYYYAKRETSTTVLEKNLLLDARFGVVITQEKNHEQNFCIALDNRFDI